MSIDNMIANRRNTISAGWQAFLAVMGQALISLPK